MQRHAVGSGSNAKAMLCAFACQPSFAVLQHVAEAGRRTLCCLRSPHSPLQLSDDNDNDKNDSRN